ncbi:MAG: hypothetical protein KAI17_17355, partial [Thiotrichaceae bacterium]|nr:hypothetical protein [Thiotrichaceae bacterium]
MKKIFSFVLFPQVLLLILLNTIPSVFMTQLVFDNAPEVYLPKELPSVVLKEKLSKLYPSDQIAMILFKGDKLYTDDFLDKLEQAAKEIKRHPKVDRVINVTEMEHIEGNEEGFEASSLLGKERRKKLKDPVKRYLFAIKDRTASDLIVSNTNEQVMAMVVRPGTLDSTMDRIALMETVYKALAKQHIDSLVYAQAGPIINEIEQFDAMIKDIVLLVPGTMIIGLLLIWFMFKRALAVLLAGLLTGAVVNATMLLFIIFSVPYTMISGMLAPLLSALTTAFLIHFYSYLKLASSYHYERKKRVIFAVEQVKKPAFYTALTTVLGLASMSVSP